MKTPFDIWFEVIKKYEGEDVVKRPKYEDPGGLTHKGITQKYYFTELYKPIEPKPTLNKFLNLSWDDVKKISKYIWNTRGVNKVNRDILKPIVADSYFHGGGIKSLGYPSIDSLNRDSSATVEKLANNRMKYLSSLPNYKYNKKGWENRINYIIEVSQQKPIGIQLFKPYLVPMSFVLFILILLIVVLYKKR